MPQPFRFLLLSRAELRFKCKVAGFQKSRIPDTLVRCNALVLPCRLRPKALTLMDLLPGSVRSRGKGTRSNSNSRGRKVKSHGTGGVGPKRHL